MKYLAIILIIIIGQCGHENHGQCPDVNETDIIMTEVEILSKSNGNVVKSKLKWPGGIIPYVITHPNDSGIIDSGISHWNRKTNINFIPRTTEKDYVEIKGRKEYGGNSYLGKIGGKQQISIYEETQSMRIVVHELGHTVGLAHEHQRTDRDDYLYVHLENVNSDKRKVDFGIEPYHTCDIGPYNYESVMHYNEKTGSNNGNVVLYRKDGKPIVPSDTLTDLDVESVHILYNELIESEE